MPFYTCDFQEGTLSADQRTAMAKAITNVHHTVTGAPESFVYVTFRPRNREDSFVGGKPARFTMVQGDIRGGRSDLDKQKLIAEITKACVRVAGVNEGELIVVVHDTPAKFIMDGGRFSPEPGQEADWLAKPRAACERAPTFCEAANFSGANRFDALRPDK